MPDFNVIADVSSTLETVLTNGLSPLNPAPSAKVHDLQGSISTNPPVLTLFLYEVVEDPVTRNRPRMHGTAPPKVTTQKAPMALMLRYMITPWSGDRPTDHRIMGRAMQVLYDSAIISGPQLQGGLKDTDQALKVTLLLLSLEERTRVWHSVQKPYRLSVVYEIRVINLDAERVTQTTAVTSRTADFATPEAKV